MQFLHIRSHSNVPQTIEQHANIQGTSSSGGAEQAQIRHIIQFKSLSNDFYINHIFFFNGLESWIDSYNDHE